MSNKKDKRRGNAVINYNPDLLPVPMEGGERKNVRRINPLGPRVLARVCKASNRSDGGLYLPEGAKQSTNESVLAQVVEVASAVDLETAEETNVSGIPLGAMVLIPRNAGVTVPWDEELRLIESRDILALVDEITIT